MQGYGIIDTVQGTNIYNKMRKLNLLCWLGEIFFIAPIYRQGFDETLLSFLKTHLESNSAFTDQKLWVLLTTSEVVKVLCLKILVVV